MANSIVISSGHGGKVAGAIGILNEHNEAVRVVEKVAEYLLQLGVTVHTFHDNVSTTQGQNLAAIVNYHNSQSRDLDISVHFNASSRTDQPRGTEVLFYDNASLASSVAGAISSASGLKNRGPKQDKGLYFLRNTKKPAVLIEVCFVDSSADANIYNTHFDDICKAIAETVAGRKVPVQPTSEAPQPQKTIYFYTGGYGGQALEDIHSFIASKNYWYQPSRNNNGTLMFTIGGFGEETAAAKEMEKYLIDHKYWYEIR